MQSAGNGSEDEAQHYREGQEPPNPIAGITGDVPGTAVQAGAIYGGVHFHSHANDEGAVCQLPLAPAGFTDREGELGRLAQVHAEVGDTRQVRLVVLTGPGGVGKTALATRFLREAMAEFPDGQLYADLAGFAPEEAVEPDETLDAFLRALGVAPGEIPRGLAARSALFRQRTKGRRIAVLLDNALSAAQVRALLPGEGAHLVVVTSRLRLTGLVAHRPRFLDIGPLDAAAAVRLLNGLVAGHRATIGAGTFRDLARLGGNLPLALCAIAGRLVMRPDRSAERMVAELDDERRRLAVLSRHEERPVRAVFDVSYLSLPEEAARLYRLLGLHPGPDFDVRAAAALAGIDYLDAEEHLEYLVAASLLGERGDGRFAFHDLLRIHARERARDDEPAREREAALERLFDYYLRTAVAADLTLNPGRWHLNPMFEDARESPAVFEGRTSALDWLATELPTLRALVLLARDSGRNQAAWQLCEALWMLFSLRKHYGAWTATHQAGLAAAEDLDDPAAQARMLVALAGAHMNLGEVDTATELYRRAHELWVRAGHRLGQAAALENLGVADIVNQDPRSAIARFTAALRIFEEQGEARGVAIMDRRLGEAHRDAGEYDAAIGYLTRAVDYLTTTGDDYMASRALVGLAACYLQAGPLEVADTTLGQALRVSQRAGARMEVARVHQMLGELAQLRGHPRSSREHLQRALSSYTELGAPEAETVRQHLADLESDTGEEHPGEELS
ncbi:tetratricopeptide (TPR) repeat protein [Lipingzhangella halophila]|uniref:Tetratricopeptide (TPR) repeat protein n=1 Tax=Lipingzhangella halophila TaxID=1783352 RepID=A0A7W7RJY4_9ACTN|nr:tetratricopeptide repeat protein [Lipingzhangella halophila]MBB4933393.1 tetratricopeptide (TPR) repeat protein [Lipingzhangella halophila]